MMGHNLIGSLFFLVARRIMVCFTVDGVRQLRKYASLIESDSERSKVAKWSKTYLGNINEKETEIQT